MKIFLRWEVLRRYSDFFFLHQTLTTQFPKLFKIPFPGKKTFGNLERNVVAKRQKMLNQWFIELLAMKSYDYPGLYDQVPSRSFLSVFLSSCLLLFCPHSWISLVRCSPSSPPAGRRTSRTWWRGRSRRSATTSRGWTHSSTYIRLNPL